MSGLPRIAAVIAAASAGCLLLAGCGQEAPLQALCGSLEMGDWSAVEATVVPLAEEGDSQLSEDAETIYSHAQWESDRAKAEASVGINWAMSRSEYLSQVTDAFDRSWGTCQSDSPDFGQTADREALRAEVRDGADRYWRDNEISLRN